MKFGHVIPIINDVCVCFLSLSLSGLPEGWEAVKSKQYGTYYVK